MQTYGIQDYGLLITPEIAAWITLANQAKTKGLPKNLKAIVDTGRFAEMAGSDLNQLCNSAGLDFDFDVECWVDYVQAALDDLKIRYSFASSFTGEANYMIFPEDNPEDCEGFGENYDDELLLYIPLKKGPSVFASQVYNNGDEIIQELRERMKGILPDDFDYRKNLAEISGTTYC